MRSSSSQHLIGWTFFAVTVLAYVARPLSCGYIEWGTAELGLYERGDRHGFVSAAGLLTALFFAAPTFWIAYRIFLNRAVRFGVLGRGQNIKTTIISVVVATALAAPTSAQFIYLGLPMPASAPALISALVWLLVMEFGRTAALDVYRGDPGERVPLEISLAMGVALLTGFPKFIGIGGALL